MITNDISVHPAKGQVLIQGSEILAFHPESSASFQAHTVCRTQSYVLLTSAPTTVVLHGEYRDKFAALREDTLSHKTVSLKNIQKFAGETTSFALLVPAAKLLPIKPFLGESNKPTLSFEFHPSYIGNFFTGGFLIPGKVFSRGKVNGTFISPCIPTLRFLDGEGSQPSRSTSHGISRALGRNHPLPTHRYERSSGPLQHS